MIYETFIDKSFHPKTLRTIEMANRIIAEFQADGYTLTLRQLYYQFVARGLRENTDKSYKSLGKIISEARLAGLISWDGIEDRGRSLSPWLIQERERAVFKDIERRFALDVWQRQDVYIEAWIEKDALSAVLERPCGQFRVPFMACKGYLSSSEAYQAGKRFEAMLEDGRRCVLLHLGDHDPSGIDMTRDNSERVHQLAYAVPGQVEVRRLALNMDQVEQYDPPTNPTKITDSRADDYIRRFGGKSWELDALDPSVIGALVTEAVEEFIDPDIWNDTIQEERERRVPLAKVYSEWPTILKFIEEELS